MCRNLKISIMVVLCFCGRAVAVEARDSKTMFEEKADISQMAGWELVVDETIDETDVIAEGGDTIIATVKAHGSIAVFAKADKTQVVSELMFLDNESVRIQAIKSCQVQNLADKVTLHLEMTNSQGAPAKMIISIDNNGIIEMTPVLNIAAVFCKADMDYAIVPDFAGDLVYDARDYIKNKNPLFFPSENIICGLLKGNKNVIVMTWPDGNQQPSIRSSKQGFEFFSLMFDKKKIYIGLIHADGVWHRQKVDKTWIEKTKDLEWKQPFKAQWVAQLYYKNWTTHRQSFYFKDKKRTEYAYTVGDYVWPVWFEKGKPVMNLSKLVLIPKSSDVLIYCRKDAEGDNKSLAKIMELTLGKEFADAKFEKEKGWHPPNIDNKIFSGYCTAADDWTPMFKWGAEVREKAMSYQLIEDFHFHFESSKKWMDSYNDNANEILKMVEAQQKKNPRLAEFIEKSKVIVNNKKIADRCQKDTTAAYVAAAEKVLQETKDLSKNYSSANYPRFLELASAMRKRVGDDHTSSQKTTFDLYETMQKLGLECVDKPDYAEFAAKMRKVITEKMTSNLLWKAKCQCR